MPTGLTCPAGAEPQSGAARPPNRSQLAQDRSAKVFRFDGPIMIISRAPAPGNRARRNGGAGYTTSASCQPPLLYLVFPQSVSPRRHTKCNHGPRPVSRGKDKKSPLVILSGPTFQLPSRQGNSEGSPDQNCATLYPKNDLPDLRNRLEIPAANEKVLPGGPLPGKTLFL
jgi:hypothetical protein